MLMVRVLMLAVLTVAVCTVRVLMVCAAVVHMVMVIAMGMLVVVLVAALQVLVMVADPAVQHNIDFIKIPPHSSHSSAFGHLFFNVTQKQGITGFNIAIVPKLGVEEI
ncbi:hypothetical protein Pelo_19133 [Pelomyxa schiedti]|nr:hypothetical protein Pelo_19133 [Pelomyxa schiedti]